MTPSLDRTNALSPRRLLPSILLLAAALLVPRGIAAQDEKPADENTVTGKLVEVKEAGRKISLVVETGENETKEFQLTARTPVEITAPADDGFLKVGQFVSAMPVATNEKLFAKEFTVSIGPGRKVGKLEKAPPMPGVSMGTYLVSGQIAARAQDKEYPEFEIITLKIGKDAVAVYLDKGYSVTVNLSDASLAKPGSTVTIEGKPGTRDRFTVTGVKMALTEPLSSEEFFADDKSSKKKRPSRRTKPEPKDKTDE